MRVPMKWLSQYVDTTSYTPAEIAKLLTARGLEIGGVEELGENIQNVVTGRILSIVKHENSDHLQICMVDVGGEEPVQIVTGAQNVKANDLVPVALHDSRLPNGLHIKKGKLRGVVSEGMLCSGEELCLTEDDYPGAGEHGILILKEDWPVGTDIREVLGMNDTVLEAEPTPNRPDLQSVIGVAREVANAIGRPLVLPEVCVKAESGRNINDFVKVEVEDAELCPRYMARTVRDIKIGPSPAWIKDALRAAGVRSINNIVDITNYVMLETGQPMHAFDLACVADRNIVVRRARDGEKLETLDGKERDLDTDMLCICDAQKPVGVAGVMGGANSEITENTQTVLFESAKFKGYSIRMTSKKLGMMTEASQRFVKGVDIEGTAYALERACQLVELLGAGTVDDGIIDVVGTDLTRRKLVARPERVNALVALDIPAERMAEILNGLCIPTTLEDGLLHIEIPHFRDDIEGEADISEEIARIVGFDEIPLTFMRGDLSRGKLTRVQKQVELVRDVLCGMGAYECNTYAFTGQSAYDKLLLAEDAPLRNSVRILNPFGEDNALMRTTVAVSLLPVAALNINKKNGDFRIFEVSNVYTPAKAENELPEGRQNACIILCGEGEDFFTLKGVVEALCAALGIEESKLNFSAGGEAYYHPGRKAVLTVGGAYAGQIGEVHPDCAANFEISYRVYMAELELDVLFAAAAEQKKFKPLPKFPAVERDIAFVLSEEYTAKQVKDVITNAGRELLEAAELFDVYQGAHIEKGKKSMAYSLRFRALERTLTDDEVAEATNRILTALSETLGAKLRS
jgi:phenylalanyl-tRNA synthetase beta chain